MRIGLKRLLAATAAAAAVAALAPQVSQAAGITESPLADPFFHYTGSKPLSQIADGTVLKTRTVSYSIQGLTLPLKAVQLLYRSENQLGQPIANVTTVIKPAVQFVPTNKVVSYQSFYDSLNPEDQPSVMIAGGKSIGGGAVHVETALIGPLLLAGYNVVVPDTEGPTADFAAGPEYGKTTLDSLRAVSRGTATGISKTAQVGLIGYSGGAIASEWAAELAATYAPDVAKRIVGTAIGGVLVKPSTNLHYVEGSQVWAGVMPMALTGIARSFQVDLSPYLSPYGRQVLAGLQKAPITDVLGQYPGLTWSRLAKPQYAVPESVPLYVKLANKLIMGTGGTPTAPMFIGQGTGGYLEGTQPGAAGIGDGDGVMVAGDVRSLARKYCNKGVSVQYQEYPLSHFTSVSLWLPQAYEWLLTRFAGAAAPNNCASIAPGNSLTPIRVASS